MLFSIAHENRSPHSPHPRHPPGSPHRLAAVFRRLHDHCHRCSSRPLCRPAWRRAAAQRVGRLRDADAPRRRPPAGCAADRQPGRFRFSVDRAGCAAGPHGFPRDDTWPQPWVGPSAGPVVDAQCAESLSLVAGQPGARLLRPDADANADALSDSARAGPPARRGRCGHPARGRTAIPATCRSAPRRWCVRCNPMPRGRRRSSRPHEPGSSAGERRCLRGCR